MRELIDYTFNFAVLPIGVDDELKPMKTETLDMTHQPFSMEAKLKLYPDTPIELAVKVAYARIIRNPNFSVACVRLTENDPKSISSLWYDFDHPQSLCGLPAHIVINQANLDNKTVTAHVFVRNS